MILLLLLFTTTPLFAFQAPSIPIQDVQADSIDFQNKTVFLEGHVVVRYEMGTIRCDRASVFLEERAKSTSSLAPYKIDLEGHVVIDFSDTSHLRANRGEIFFQRQEAIFYGSDSDKVLYRSFCRENDKPIPVLASGKKIIAKIVKGTDGKSTLSDIRGEGSVTIEYLRSVNIEGA